MRARTFYSQSAPFLMKSEYRETNGGTMQNQELQAVIWLAPKC